MSFAGRRDFCLFEFIGLDGTADKLLPASIGLVCGRYFCGHFFMCRQRQIAWREFVRVRFLPMRTLCWTLRLNPFSSAMRLARRNFVSAVFVKIVTMDAALVTKGRACGQDTPLERRALLACFAGVAVAQVR
ncbi:hypothetical protein [Paraburkholderia dilworthii]|uniref:Uncharacterized protein n=1 Tax=Paraburkholderia dilworthii TaxID=948106 RepID=A0ABW9D2G1_9BURK